MRIAIHSGSFGDGASAERALSESAAAGFDSIEWIISTEGPVTFDSPRDSCEAIGRRARELGIGVSGLVIANCGSAYLGAGAECDRRAARDQLLAALDRATWLGANAVTLAVARLDAADTPARCEEILWRVEESLLELRFEAERRAIQMACECATGGFLTSPVEARAMIDRVNSRWVGAQIEIDAAHDAEDWIMTLGRRIVRACFSSGEGAQWARAAEALRRVRFGGPTVYRGHEDLRAARARLGALFETR